MNLPKAVLFDLDGVLVDATEIHYEALNKALGLFGYSIGQKDHVEVYNGLPTRQKLEMMSNTQGLPRSLHNVIASQKKIYTEHLVRMRCKPAYDKIMMMEFLYRNDVFIGCCSNAVESSVNEMLTLSGLIDYFQVVVGNDSFSDLKPKPAPDIYEWAIEKLSKRKINAEDIWIVEDAPHGVTAAIASGAGRVITVNGYQDVNLSLFV